MAVKGNVVGDVIHSFVRVRNGKPDEHYALQSVVNVNGTPYRVTTAFPFTANNAIMQVLEAQEHKLAKAVGENLVMGVKPPARK